MRLRIAAILIVGLCVGLLVAAPSPAQPDDAPPDGVEVQARGPVHEAFGEPTRSDPVSGALATSEPPQPIEESPPDNKPEGDDVVWIPGYWAWDGEENEYLWISGFWRAVPPGRAWMPGHWQKAMDGYRWVSGYWGLPAAAGSEEPEEVEYLPEPPRSLDRGPSVPAPEETSNYVPGCWVWSSTRYVWRPGHWVAHRPGWVWVPACYRWTPGGFIFVSGYWDLPLLERGLLFAPVRFARPVWRTAGFVYRPTFVVQPDFLCGALFVAVDAPCYYFGDYFTVGYRRRMVPWVSYRPHRSFWDVNFAYYRHAYARHHDWERNLNTLYTGRYEGAVPRPPRTLVQQTTVINQINVNKTTNVVVNKNVNITNVQNVSVLAPITKVKNVQVTALSALAGPAATTVAPTRQLKIEKVSRERLVEEQKSAARLRAVSQERRTAEAKLVAQTPTAEPRKTPVKVKMKLPKGTPPARVVRSSFKAPPPPVESEAKKPRPGKASAVKPATLPAKPGKEKKDLSAKPDKKPGDRPASKVKPGTPPVKPDPIGKTDRKPDASPDEPDKMPDAPAATKAKATTTSAKIEPKGKRGKKPAASSAKPGTKPDVPSATKAKSVTPQAKSDPKGKTGKKPVPKPVPAPPSKDEIKDAKDKD